MPFDTNGGQQRGVLTRWNDDRGFGFIEPVRGGPRLFAHVSAFPRGRRPADGCEVTFVEASDQNNRARAEKVKYLRSASTRRAGNGAIPAAVAVATVFFAALAALVVLDWVSVVVAGAYALLSLLAFGMYGADKSAAKKGQWRTSESTLHTIAVVGGWPGALVARQVFRHKTTKQPFRTIFWFTVVANCALLAWFVLGAPVTLPI